MRMNGCPIPSSALITIPFVIDHTQPNPEGTNTMYMLALLIFAFLSAVCWFVAVALYQSKFAGPMLSDTLGYRRTARLAVGATALTSFLPFPAGYLAGLVVWALAVFAGLGLPPGRATVLFLLLAAGSFVTRLIVLGVMSFLGV